MPASATVPGKHSDPMPENEHATLRAWMQTHGSLTPQQVQSIVGPSANGRTRQIIEQLLTAWLASRTKAS